VTYTQHNMAYTDRQRSLVTLPSLASPRALIGVGVVEDPADPELDRSVPLREYLYDGPPLVSVAVFDPVADLDLARMI